MALSHNLGTSMLPMVARLPILQTSNLLLLLLLHLQCATPIEDEVGSLFRRSSSSARNLWGACRAPLLGDQDFCDAPQLQHRRQPAFWLHLRVRHREATRSRRCRRRSRVRESSSRCDGDVGHRYLDGCEDYWRSLCTQADIMIWRCKYNKLEATDSLVSLTGPALNIHARSHTRALL